MKVLYEDNALLAVDKPAGLTVHPGAGTRGETVIEQLAAEHPALAKVERSGLVHRLDKGTSGVLLLAKTDAAKAALGKQFADRLTKKRYVALVVGVPERVEAVIDAPITRHHAARKKMTGRPDGRAAETRYVVTKTFGTKYALLDVWPTTGRTHQIRVHLAALGHPIVGDPTYGTTADGLDRPFLHAAELQLDHPETGERLTVAAPLPAELSKFIKTL